MDDTSDNDDLFTQADGDLHNTKPLYFNSNITVEQAYIYICDYISEFKLTLVQQKRLILLLILLLPNDSLLNQKHLSKWMSVKNSFTYSVLCAHCTNILDTKTGICSILCPMNGKLRTDDGIIETCLADIKGSMSRVAERNIDLIMEYPKQAKFLVPNDIINGTIYQRDATNDPTITIQLHSDGFDILTTKHKHCYATTATILEIPPPLRDYAQNKILLSLYFSKKEPTPECLLNNLIKRLDELRTIGLTVINFNKKINFKIKFQGDKNDQPCRSLKWKISQFNGFDACTNCLQHGETRNSNMVYYPYTTNPTPRTQQMYLNAARMADSRTTVTQHAIVQGIKGTSPLLKIFDNVSEHALFDYMHACCGSSGHMAHVLRRWITSASANVAQSMSDFILNIMMPHDTKVSFKLLSQIDWWKSKDYRFFLLYISMPFAINYVPHQVTSHYVLFFISIRILHYYQYRTDIDYADMFIDNYRIKSECVRQLKLITNDTTDFEYGEITGGGSKRKHVVDLDDLNVLDATQVKNTTNSIIISPKRASPASLPPLLLNSLSSDPASTNAQQTLLSLLTQHPTQEQQLQSTLTQQTPLFKSSSKIKLLRNKKKTNTSASTNDPLSPQRKQSKENQPPVVMNDRDIQEVFFNELENRLTKKIKPMERQLEMLTNVVLNIRENLHKNNDKLDGIMLPTLKKMKQNVIDVKQCVSGKSLKNDVPVPQKLTLIYKEKNVMRHKKPTTTCSAFARKVAADIFTREDILNLEHVNSSDPRCKVIEEAVSKAYGWSTETYEAKYSVLRNSLVQLRRDILAGKCLKIADQSEENGTDKQNDNNEQEQVEVDNENQQDDLDERTNSHTSSSLQSSSCSSDDEKECAEEANGEKNDELSLSSGNS
ncbi:unnamed protein product [Didymodactylos carnosus]|uniref:Transposase n=1 Tax=Didymodactylos carnosus TaxID=1234261 RepID=A0A8S2HHM7_9BILA|nr:unnamed protein product [Didymodactylos carnosus]CAF3647017.1 unnamed protein product [Didymodactylos carnosus]